MEDMDHRKYGRLLRHARAAEKRVNQRIIARMRELSREEDLGPITPEQKGIMEKICSENSNLINGSRKS